MGHLRWKVTCWDRVERGNIIIYEGEIVELSAEERISFHFTIRSDLFVADILAETTGGYRFVDYLKGKFGEPEDEPVAIFHGEFGDGVPALPISVWWKVKQGEAISVVEGLIKEKEGDEVDGRKEKG
jgi:hypothetical protein